MELFQKKDSRFYWYDFKLRGKRYRGSTKETNKKRAGKIAALRLSQALGGAGLLDRKAPESAGVLDPISSLDRIGNSGKKDKKVLRQWLASTVEHKTRQDAPGPDHKG